MFSFNDAWSVFVSWLRKGARRSAIQSLLGLLRSALLFRESIVTFLQGHCTRHRVQCCKTDESITNDIIWETLLNSEMFLGFAEGSDPYMVCLCIVSTEQFPMRYEANRKQEVRHSKFQKASELAWLCCTSFVRDSVAEEKGSKLTKTFTSVMSSFVVQQRLQSTSTP